MENLLEKYLETVRHTETMVYSGKVFAVRGLLIESRGPRAVIGELCYFTIEGEAAAERRVMAEVTGLRDNIVQLMAYSDTAGITVGTRVTATGHCLEVPVSPALLGRILGPLGTPIDGKGEIQTLTRYPAAAQPPPALGREVIRRRITTGVRAVDALLPVGQGQRLGIFAGSGVGKSTFQGMLARNTSADVNVIALVGERGRELNDFLEKSLGQDGLERSVVVVATSDQSSLSRLRGAFVATAVAEYFRDQGLNVMFFLDSLTRLAHAQREIGLASGEPPAQRGYTPSVFDMMPRLLERAGPAEKGSITAFYTVLVDGDDLDEPISDKARSILDGHIVLSRALASRGHYPAVDVLGSVSRVAQDVAGAAEQQAAARLRTWMADYASNEDVINAGAYKAGANPAIDAAILKKSAIDTFLRQPPGERSTLEETLQALAAIAEVEIPEEERS
ncbi:MAG: FliI/YscN family ATPase [Spirochaetaceae bacterium]|jgi:flagellum-specific ATP synthase|nr:FliI/YscN family ATPase [Spirochaetaceae bacterium]